MESKWFHVYCTIFTWYSHSGGRFSVLTSYGLKQIETKPQNIQNKNTESHQLPMSRSWKPYPLSRRVDAFHQSWRNLKGYAFLAFFIIGKVLRKVQIEMATIILITAAWQGQSWYPKTLQMSIRNPILIPRTADL